MQAEHPEHLPHRVRKRERVTRKHMYHFGHGVQTVLLAKQSTGLTTSRQPQLPMKFQRLSSTIASQVTPRETK